MLLLFYRYVNPKKDNRRKSSGSDNKQGCSLPLPIRVTSQPWGEEATAKGGGQGLKFPRMKTMVQDCQYNQAIPCNLRSFFSIDSLSKAILR